MVDVLASPSQWSQLRTMRPQSEDALAVIPILVDGKDTGLSFGMDQPGQLHLLIPVCQGPIVAPPADLNGLKVRHRRLASGEILDLSAPPSHERVFTPFCAEIVDAVARQSRDPWKAVAATIRSWQSAWKPARSSMDKITQVGLFGELLVLHSLMLPTLGCAAVDQWSGPDSERHDFVGATLHIEVKTTRKSRPEHEISRVDQLRAPAGTSLLFVSVQLEETIGGTESLATRVDAIVDLLRRDGSAMDLFMTKMANLGWSEEFRNSGELLRFFVRNAEVFVVDDHFPRIPDEFTAPSGVVSVKYTVDLANLPSLSREEAVELIKAGNNIGRL